MILPDLRHHDGSVCTTHNCYRDHAEVTAPRSEPRRFCDPPTTHRYKPVMTKDGRAFTTRIRCKRCGYEREG